MPLPAPVTIAIFFVVTVVFPSRRRTGGSAAVSAQDERARSLIIRACCSRMGASAIARARSRRAVPGTIHFQLRAHDGESVECPLETTHLMLIDHRHVLREATTRRFSKDTGNGVARRVHDLPIGARGYQVREALACRRLGNRV